ncbi:MULTISPECIES: hypothetical protein [Acinetobacter]|uniref:hypothetical protein n=1 Tax=Acinetobacter TaxID=469 RepID=UPI00097F79FF|nr:MULTISPECIES: hypothetical protein [Acinetobacter]MEB3795544.1 hypothetical protein [Acinetobacter sp. IK24]MEB3814693.1 hypothetical protein [Acinetobacter sp. IK22]MEB3833867.1 hypothetical protein [Acinetobacter sp. IK23]MEB3837834.1 hypothetical protein [Acinetobacter sp. IK25]
MEIIIQISAWVFLAVGLFALAQKFFPNFKNWITTGKVSYIWLIVITLGLFVFLTYPYFFNWWAINFWGVPEKELSDLTKLGPLGDIYGSLNTLISSIALCAVAFSAYLQVTSLNETRITNKQQLVLAEKSHQEQLKESKHAVFSNTFNTLLNLKQDRYNGLKIRNKDTGTEYISEEIFVEIALRFLWLLDNYFHEENCGRYQVGLKLDEFLELLGGKKRGFGEITSYFMVYGDLIKLIRKSDLSDESKFFYRDIVSNSMSIHEQLTLLWVAVNNKDCLDLVHGSEIFNNFYRDNMMSFLIKYFDKSCFSHPDILSNWDKYQNNQNPA